MADNLSPDNKPMEAKTPPEKTDAAPTTAAVDKKSLIETPPQGTPIPRVNLTPATPVPDKKALIETPPTGTPIPQIATPPVAATPPAAPVPDKKAILETPPQGTPTPQIATPPAVILPMPETSKALPDIENPYILSGEVDRARLVAQSKLFRRYIEANAQRLVGDNITSVLDVGCGEGQLTQVFAKLYPNARIVGVDRDEKAIESARRAARGIANIEFVVGDVQESLPAGPFDLIYGSMVLYHVPNTAKIVENIYKALKPGGTFWSKELDTAEMPVPNHPLWLRIAELVLPMHKAIGGHPDIVTELPGVLKNTGFTEIKTESELYPFGNTSPDGRIVMAVNLGAFWNARKFVSKLNQIPETEIEKVYKDAVDSFTKPDAPTGHFTYYNIVSRRPVQPVAVTPPQPATPVFAVPASAAALPDIENPYILSQSGEVDRARLVAMSRLYRGYIEKNTKQLVGENVKSVLDIGCAEGQLTQVFARLYPEAQVIGIDRDEKAIDAARRAAKGIPNLTFEVRDLLQGLPSGPFDLVYASFVFMHLPAAPKALQLVYDVLKPGGYLWSKETSRRSTEVFDHPAAKRVWTLLDEGMKRFGGNFYISEEMPELMKAAGFTDIIFPEESYEAGHGSAEGRISISIGFGAFYNARMMISKALQIPESELVALYKEAVDYVMSPSTPMVRTYYRNILARRPLTTDKVSTTTAAESPAVTASGSAVSPDTKTSS